MLFRSVGAGDEPRVGPERFPSVPYPEAMFVPTPREGGDGRAAAHPRARREQETLTP